MGLSQPHSKRSRVLSFGKGPDSSGQGGFETSSPPCSHDLRLGYAPVCPWCLGLAPELCVAVIPVSHTEALGIRSSGLVPHQHLFIQPTFHFTRDDWFSLPSWLSASCLRGQDQTHILTSSTTHVQTTCTRPHTCPYIGTAYLNS